MQNFLWFLYHFFMLQPVNLFLSVTFFHALPPPPCCHILVFLSSALFTVFYRPMTVEMIERKLIRKLISNSFYLQSYLKFALSTHDYRDNREETHQKTNTKLNLQISRIKIPSQLHFLIKIN